MPSLGWLHKDYKQAQASALTLYEFYHCFCVFSLESNKIRTAGVLKEREKKNTIRWLIEFTQDEKRLQTVMQVESDSPEGHVFCLFSSVWWQQHKQWWLYTVSCTVGEAELLEATSHIGSPHNSLSKEIFKLSYVFTCNFFALFVYSSTTHLFLCTNMCFKHKCAELMSTCPRVLVSAWISCSVLIFI